MTHEAWLRLNTSTGKVKVLGIEQPEADILAQRDDVIVLKVPGHNYWTGRGEQSYAGGEFQVWQFVGDESNGSRKARSVIDFPVRTKKES